MERSILHADCNKFYASVECLHRPEIRSKPVIVGGDEDLRHGIVLTKNEIASKFGIKTAEPIWQARQKCPDLVVVKPNYPLYLRFSALTREIYADYTDQIEPFGLDECWLDVTGSGIFGNGMTIAEEIRRRVKFELGITVSIGVSYNKIFAKLGSDYKKPDAVTQITKRNFKDIVWPLPAQNLLYVGRSTAARFRSCGIFTIGDIALCTPEYLHMLLGKTGYMYHVFANGLDNEPVSKMGNKAVVKSIGNSSTAPRDLENEQDVKVLMYVLGESVARRMREQGFCCKTVCITVRDNALLRIERQGKLPAYSADTGEITKKAMELFRKNYNWRRPVRSIGISCTDFEQEDFPAQLDLYGCAQRRAKAQRLDKTVDELEERFGNFCVQRGLMLTDRGLSGFNPYSENVIHPIGYFKPQ
ncbi:MAG: DNA polymerase Y family protein [Acutalibacteraceae bacterium]|jgi:DNA polymerase-4